MLEPPLLSVGDLAAQAPIVPIGLGDSAIDFIEK
jgi:hypothetical protein